MEDKMYLRQKVFTKKDIENQINGLVKSIILCKILYNVLPVSH